MKGDPHPFLVLREKRDFGNMYRIPRGVKPIHLNSVLVNDLAEVLDSDEKLPPLTGLDLKLLL